MEASQKRSQKIGLQRLVKGKRYKKKPLSMIPETVFKQTEQDQIISGWTFLVCNDNEDSYMIEDILANIRTIVVLGDS